MNPTLQKLKGNTTIKFVTKDSELGDLEWVIKPVPFTLLLEHFDKFTGMPTDATETSSLSSEQAVKLQKSIYPMMKAIIPKCIVEPTVVLEGPTNDDQLNIDDIPFGSVVELFNKIIEITGLDKVGEEDRKKLPTVQSDKA